MKKIIASPSVLMTRLIVVLGVLLASCGPSAPQGNTQAWVEFPYEGSILPMQPIPLAVYASDATGISYIQVKVNGQSLPAVTVQPLTSDGSTRLVRVDMPFTPVAEGEYIVEAAGVNSAGTVGGSGSTRFCVVTCSPDSGTSTPAAVETQTPTPSPFIENTNTPTTLPTFTVPPPTFTELPPVIEPSATFPPPPSDTSGPNINAVSVYWYPESCSLFGTADITDESGVAWAEFHFNLNDNGWAWIKMNQSGTTWTSQVGVDTGANPGTLIYKVRTLDSLNNESWSGEFSKNFAYCGD